MHDGSRTSACGDKITVGEEYTEEPQRVSFLAGDAVPKVKGEQYGSGFSGEGPYHSKRTGGRSTLMISNRTGASK